MIRVKFFACCTILAMGLQLAGCYTDFGPVVTAPEPISPSAVAARLQTGDRLKMTIYGEENLSGFYDINPAGTVALPLVGAIRAAGRTRSELEREIASAYRRGNYLQDPKVTVAVVEFRPFYMMGETVNQGQFPYRNGLTVLTAISTAGGLTYRASRSSVLIQHAGQTEWEEYAMTANVLISPGDLIRVPERYF